MNNSPGMGGVQRARQLDCDLQQVTGSDRLAIDEVLQGPPIEVLHNDKRTAVMLADIVNRANLRVIQSRGGARFNTKSFQRLRVACPFLGEELQRDSAAQANVFSLIDHTHAARSQAFQDAIM